MPAARYVPYRYGPRPAAKSKPAASRPVLRLAPPSGDLINAVIQYADRIKDLGGHRSLLRLSERRMADPVITAALGREAERLADVAVIWDDEEDQIVRVLDAAAGDLVAPTSSMQPLGEEEVELTPDALAYLAASQGRLH
jgi:hypothetical protein